MKKTPNTLLNRLSLEEYRCASKIPLVIVLDNIRSLLNIGSIFRTCDAFLIEAIYLCGITACPPHRDIHKTALGATDAVSWKYFKSTVEALDDLQMSGYVIWALEQTNESVLLDRFSLEPHTSLALVLGNEVKGVSSEVLDKVDGAIEIPQYGSKHSFNVSVSVGIALWHIYQQCYKTE